jgi:hypothetical protein
MEEQLVVNHQMNVRIILFPQNDKGLKIYGFAVTG